MNAEHARKLMKKAAEVEAPGIEALLNSWHQAIDKAARAGKNSVREAEVGRLRMPISAAQRKATLARLKADGFTVNEVATGPNEGETEVSW